MLIKTSITPQYQANATRSEGTAENSKDQPTSMPRDGVRLSLSIDIPEPVVVPFRAVGGIATEVISGTKQLGSDLASITPREAGIGAAAGAIAGGVLGLLAHGSIESAVVIGGMGAIGGFASGNFLALGKQISAS